MWLITYALKNWQFLIKFNIHLTYNPAILLLGKYSNKIREYSIHTDLYMNVHCNLTQNKKLEITQKSINSWWGKRMMVWILSKEKGWTSDAPTTSCCAKEAGHKGEHPLLLHSYQVQVQGQAKLICADINQCQVLPAGKGQKETLQVERLHMSHPVRGGGVTQVYTLSWGVCWSLLRCPIATIVN